MGFETMRRWPVFFVFAVSLMLCLFLLNSWTTEKYLSEKLDYMTAQLSECSEFKVSMESYMKRDNEKETKLIKDIDTLRLNFTQAEEKARQAESLVNRTQVDVVICKTELQSLKNLQMTKSATLDTLRLEKETLTAELEQRKEKISELEAEVEKLKQLTNGKTPANPPVIPKVTPAAPPVKSSSVMGAPINQPVIENNAKEEEDDIAANSLNFNDFN